MIVVDSSVWIAHFRNESSKQVDLLSAMTPSLIVVGDIIMIELLKGLDTDRQAETLVRKFERYGVVPMLDPELAEIGASNYRKLRRRGITIRTTPDVIIATYCIEHGHELLHNDRDFDHFEQHLGLRVVR